jgi:hypothetical protein
MTTVTPFGKHDGRIANDEDFAHVEAEALHGRITNESKKYNYYHVVMWTRSDAAGLAKYRFCAILTQMKCIAATLECVDAEIEAPPKGSKLASSAHGD